MQAQERIEQTSSEADALADILTWSTGCPKWQRDALRRFCTKGELDEADLKELTELCKNGGVGAVPLAREHIPDPQSAAFAITLRAIREVENVNALKAGERLTFDKSGLTVVYGDNGSGKSGYARILKKVCRARTPPKGDRILPNIYTAKPGTSKAVIDFSANGQNKSETWAGESAADPLLSAVSVFDSRTANIHVNEVNDVAYTPFPMRVLEQLAEACKEIKKRVSAEIMGLEEQTPEAIKLPNTHGGTTTAKLIAELNGGTNEQDIRNLAALNDKEKARLETLKADLGNDPTKAARKNEAQREKLVAAREAFARLSDATTDERVARLRRLHSAYESARRAAEAAASDLFADEPLPDAGSDVWRALWEAARDYSTQKAYPDLAFPMTSEGARCVLCQQELDAEAAGRMVRFEKFVKDETKRKEELALEAFNEAVDVMDGGNIGASEVAAISVFVRDELNDGELAGIIRRSLVTAKWRLRAALRGDAVDESAVIPAISAWPNEAIAAHEAALSERISALRAEDESDERAKLRDELYELSDREWLAVVLDDVLAEIGRRKKIAVLHDRAKDTSTNKITTMSGEIAEQLVTNTLRAEFAREVDKLGVAGLAIELRKEKSSYGVPHFRVSLMRKPAAKVGEVLSEGEHRCVALAAFMAELATTESRSGIVFDDPVSSLDHMHREAVAKRLAAEGEHRQIIVLTHDIAFLFLLDQECREKRTHIAFRSVTRTDDHAGFVQLDPPARAQPIEKVIEGMQKQLDNQKALYISGDHDGWESAVDALQKRLRSTWERAVEEAVGPVLKRLSNKVETKGLAKLTMLTMEDCVAMRKAYGRCSVLLHSSADALNSPLPKPEAVQHEITALKEWVEKIKAAQSKIEYLQ
ncbi:hypothetical protein C7T96_18595 [Nitratireductor sp. StC3]|nr:hypothetical protein C7T96_18595 [Nitratireductor sp. StC3]